MILLGTVKKENKHYEIKVSFIYAHPNYKKLSGNDVAILYLDEDITMSGNFNNNIFYYFTLRYISNIRK